MIYVVTENRLRCNYMDGVQVGPVDGFYAGKNFLVTAPDECIDCDVCEPERSAAAIVADAEAWNGQSDKIQRLSRKPQGGA